ncbi:MAG: hypothetical protein JO022_17735 [Acidobacteriaceae bacterium]|nr:hypothetical protein [Acidobacteriaceae bacterium]
MASEDLSAAAWLACGAEAYLKRRFTEAAEHFEKAAATDPESAQAHLALGAARLTLYRRRPSPVSTYLFATRDFSERELAVHQENEKAILDEQNATNWRFAENSLKRANQLEPENSLIVEYLCALYFYWKDPLDKDDRVNEAKQWLERLLELEPQHKYANFQCGLVLMAKARKLLPNYGRFPPGPELDLPSDRMKARPLLEEANQHLERALALHGEQTAASFLLDDVTSMQAYIEDPDLAARDLRHKLGESFNRHVQGKKTDTQAADSATITFSLSPDALAEDRKRPFPPNPWRIPVT